MRILEEGELNKNFQFWVGQRVRCLKCMVLFVLQEGDKVIQTRKSRPIYGRAPRTIVGYIYYYRVRCPGKKSGWSNCGKMLNFWVEVFYQLVLGCPVGASRKQLEDLLGIP